MVEFEIFTKGITAGQMSKWFDVGLNEFCNTLSAEFNKKFESHSVLLRKHYDFVVVYYYKNEENFKTHKYGKYLRGRELHIKNEINYHIKSLKTNCIKSLIDEINKRSEILQPVILDSTKLLPHIDTTFEIYYRGKAGDDDSVHIHYLSKFGNLKFTKTIEKLTEFSNKPYQIKVEYQKKEIDYKMQIPKIKFELIRNLVLFKQIDLYKIVNVDYIYDLLIDIEYLEFKNYKLQPLVDEILKSISVKNKIELYNYYLTPFDKFDATENLIKVSNSYNINTEINHYKSRKIYFE